MAKKLIISGGPLTIDGVKYHSPDMKLTVEGEDLQVSDGHHTMREVYEHRYVLFCKLLQLLSMDGLAPLVWKSKLHSDGTMFDDSFICGIGDLPGHQITYHLPLKYWDGLDILELDNAPIWDGHGPADVLERLREL